MLALPSLGATTHKGLTRVAGCAIGSLFALAASVFVIPHLDGIVGLLGMTLPVIALAAWIASGSARSNYVGVQIVFTFALALLGHFGPTTDLTEIRDRMLGILLGVAVTLTIFTLLWPERDSDGLEAMLGRLLRAIAGLVRAGAGAAADASAYAAIDQARLQGWALLSENREMQARVALEPGWQYAHDSVTADLTSWLAQAQEMLLAVDYLQVHLRHARTQLTPQEAATLDRYCMLMAGHLERLADGAIGADEQGRARAGKEVAELASLLATLPPEEVPEKNVPEKAAGLAPEQAPAPPLAALFAAVRAVHESVVQLVGPPPIAALTTSMK
jgi:multidrug resistance protein MdtO